MGSSPGPVVANIIMTELENTIIKPLINDNTIKFYSCFIDDTLLVVEAEHIPRIHNLLNQFDHNLQFTVDTFKVEIPHFLDLEISNNGLSIYRKDTHTDWSICEFLKLYKFALSGKQLSLSHFNLFTIFWQIFLSLLWYARDNFPKWGNLFTIKFIIEIISNNFIEDTLGSSNSGSGSVGVGVGVGGGGSGGDSGSGSGSGSMNMNISFSTLL